MIKYMSDLITVITLNDIASANIYQFLYSIVLQLKKQAAKSHNGHIAKYTPNEILYQSQVSEQSLFDMWDISTIKKNVEIVSNKSTVVSRPKIHKSTF